MQEQARCAVLVSVELIGAIQYVAPINLNFQLLRYLNTDLGQLLTLMTVVAVSLGRRMINAFLQAYRESKRA